MTSLDRIQVARAEEQMRSVRMDEPMTHDRWQIRGKGEGRANGKGKAWHPSHCRACDRKATHATYCKQHWQRVQLGIDVDVDSFPTWTDYRRMSRGGKRFGGRRKFGRRTLAAGGE